MAVCSTEESRELLLQEISQMEQNVFKSHMEQIKAEHSASEGKKWPWIRHQLSIPNTKSSLIARVERDRITVAHNVQQRLLNRVDYDTERISMRTRKNPHHLLIKWPIIYCFVGADVLGLDNEEDIHAELEQIYRDRDRIQELFQKEREDHEHLVCYNDEKDFNGNNIEKNKKTNIL